MRKVNISLNDCFGEKIKMIREREKNFSPDINWFCKMDIERLDTYMTKFQFI
ncbi:Uncharacterised protein [Providencia rettgeri]|uniref:Uncharacterized protein n=1 Tax=Providencia rettgeri TaxID=587 RepID=A0A379LQ65_PRORE|nr:Uncharacterised protein [Providencia rettgeri]